jgi:hypothetical protein
MSIRPIFIPSIQKDTFVHSLDVNFTWFPGFSKEQKQRSIQSLHEEALKNEDVEKILEISTKSLNPIGVKASAFNLQLKLKNSLPSSVESFYQGSKVFEKGGPYIDLYSGSAMAAKKDERIKSSGQLLGFHFQGIDWGLNDYFYDWLYLMGLHQNPELAFNPKKSYNCQAYTAALYISASLRGIQLEDIQSPRKFKEAFPSEKLISFKQLDLF